MNIADIIALAYFGIGCISAAVALVELCSIGKGLPKGLPFTFLGVMFFGNLILWPLFIPTSILQYREIKGHIARSDVGKNEQLTSPMYYSILEQHVDGWWWYHPRLTGRNVEEVCGKVSDWMRETRPVIVIEHDKPFPAEDWTTLDFKNFRNMGGADLSDKIECRVLKRIDTFRKKT